MINDTNVSVSEITSELRAPPQGVNTASNSNVDIDTYDKMAVLNAASGNNNTTAFTDFKNTFGVVGGTFNYTSGSTKGSSTTVYTGVAGTGAMNNTNTGIASSQKIGNFGLGNSGGTTGQGLETSAGFSNIHSMIGLFSTASLLGGQIYLVFNATSTDSASKWSSISFRYLGSNSDGTETLSGSNYFVGATTLNRTDAAVHHYASGTTDRYTWNWGLGQTITINPLAAMGTRPFVVRFD